MKQYLDLIKDVLENGTRQANRTGIDAISLPGAMLKFDLSEGFPAVTTKKLVYTGSIGETVGFLQGVDNAARFRELGCKFWDQNANENAAWLANPNRKGQDDLGRVYGVQWRDWRASDGSSIDQVMRALETIRNDPTNRRIIINAWRPDEFPEMALPPCHALQQYLVNVEKNTLNLCMYQRSGDIGLGVPMNVFSSALMLSLFARLTGYKPGVFTHFLADAHIYVNHLDQLREQIKREPHPLPQLVINDRVPEFHRDGFHPEWIDKIVPSDFQLVNYIHHDPIKMAMAV